MPRPRPQSRRLNSAPIITFTSDFGLLDSYAAELKAAALKVCRDLILIDVTHNVPRHDILCGSITLARAIDGFPAGTIHVAVVDPGVGTDRRLVVAEIRKQFVVCPDNGLITWAWRLHGGIAYELTWRPAKVSSTFHGRDILAPAAARLAAGGSISSIARRIDDPVLLDVAPAEKDSRRGQIIQIDHFGNAVTNIPAEMVCNGRAVSVRAGGRSLGRLRKTYWSVSPGKPLALVGSSGLLEIAVRDGSAAEMLGLKVGDPVEVR